MHKCSYGRLIKVIEGLSLAVALLLTGSNLSNASEYFAPHFDISITGIVQFPQGVVSADFNGDGNPDLAVVLIYMNSTSIYMNDGSGSLYYANSYSNAVPPNYWNSQYPFPYPYSIVAADINGDGILDLCSTNDHSVSARLGNGDGSFQEAMHIFAGLYPYALAVGDFNGDGKLDVVTTHTWGGYLMGISILIGNGDGTFERIGSYGTSKDPKSVVTADFNGDGKLDIATGNQFYVSIFLGNGDGTFQASAFNHDSENADISAGDFDNDGKIDLVAGTLNDVVVFKGNGDGTFLPPVHYNTAVGDANGGYRSGISVSRNDFNGDGYLDIAAANWGRGNVSLLLNNGDGTFLPYIEHPTGGSPFAIISTDLNKDGRPDIITGNYQNTMSILFNALPPKCSLVANAGTDQVVEQTSASGALVSLNGSASTGQNLAYGWAWPGGTATGMNPTVLLPAGTTTVTLTVSSGSCTATSSVSATIRDTTPPSSTASIGGTAGSNGWYKSDVTLNLDAVDSGSGVKEIHARIDGGSETVFPGNRALLNITSEGVHSVKYFATDYAGNKEAIEHIVNVNIDKTSPEIVISGVADGATYIVGAVPAAGYTAADGGSGVESHSASISGGIIGGVGKFTYTVVTVDKAGNAAQKSVTYTVAYSFSGFLPPVSLDKVFKLGSTIPVKFQLQDAMGNYVASAHATIMIQQYSGNEPVGEPIEVNSTSGADVGNAFRYSSADNLYIYNLNTQGLSQGTWKAIVMLDDSTVKSVFIRLK